jgi:uncharacterized protein (DUF433 family)
MIRYIGGLIMAEPAISYEHVALNDKKEPIISGTNMKVIELVSEKTAHGWSPEELYLQHPYLSLGQIHSALAYYWDHKKKLDAEIKKRLEYVKQSKKSLKTASFAEKLVENKLI